MWELPWLLGAGKRFLGDCCRPGKGVGVLLFAAQEFNSAACFPVCSGQEGGDRGGSR